MGGGRPSPCGLSLSLSPSRARAAPEAEGTQVHFPPGWRRLREAVQWAQVSGCFPRSTALFTEAPAERHVGPGTVGHGSELCSTGLQPRGTRHRDATSSRS